MAALNSSKYTTIWQIAQTILAAEGKDLYAHGKPATCFEILKAVYDAYLAISGVEPKQK